MEMQGFTSQLVQYIVETTLVIRSPRSKGGPENMVPPNTEKGFGFLETVELAEG